MLENVSLQGINNKNKFFITHKNGYLKKKKKKKWRYLVTALLFVKDIIKEPLTIQIMSKAKLFTI